MDAVPSISSLATTKEALSVPLARKTVKDHVANFGWMMVRWMDALGCGILALKTRIAACMDIVMQDRVTLALTHT